MNICGTVLNHKLLSSEEIQQNYEKVSQNYQNIINGVYGPIPSQ